MSRHTLEKQNFILSNFTHHFSPIFIIISYRVTRNSAQYSPPSTFFLMPLNILHDLKAIQEPSNILSPSPSTTERLSAQTDKSTSSIPDKNLLSFSQNILHSSHTHSQHVPPPHSILYAPLPSCTHFFIFSPNTLYLSHSPFILFSPPFLKYSHPHAASSSQLLHSQTLHPPTHSPLFHAIIKAYTTHKITASFFTVPHFYAFTPLQNKAQ